MSSSLILSSEDMGKPAMSSGSKLTDETSFLALARAYQFVSPSIVSTKRVRQNHKLEFWCLIHIFVSYHLSLSTNSQTIYRQSQHSNWVLCYISFPYRKNILTLSFITYVKVNPLIHLHMLEWLTSADSLCPALSFHWKGIDTAFYRYSVFSLFHDFLLLYIYGTKVVWKWENYCTPKKYFRCDNILHRKYVPLPQNKYTMKRRNIWGNAPSINRFSCRPRLWFSHWNWLTRLSYMKWVISNLCIIGNNFGSTLVSC